jgi:large subunit ribosomal protein L47
MLRLLSSRLRPRLLSPVAAPLGRLFAQGGLDALQLQRLPSRALSTSVEPPRNPLADFMDPYDIDPNTAAPGRPWTAAELRKKSSADLEVLWIVLCKERNMLLTSRYHHRVMKTEMQYPDRLMNVKRSIARLKSVVRERDIFNADLAAARKDEALNEFMRPLPRPPPLESELA